MATSTYQVTLPAPDPSATSQILTYVDTSVAGSPPVIVPGFVSGSNISGLTVADVYDFSYQDANSAGASNPSPVTTVTISGGTVVVPPTPTAGPTVVYVSTP